MHENNSIKLFSPEIVWRAFFLKIVPVVSAPTVVAAAPAVNNAASAAARSSQPVHFPRHLKVLEAA